MKRILFLLPVLFFAANLRAQTILFENFSSGTNPSNWEFSSNTDVHSYQRPPLCTNDFGLETPAVGKNAPSRLILPSLVYDAANNIISLTFKVYVFDANLNCSSAKDAFPCPTYVTAMLVKSSYAGGTNHLPAAGDIYTSQSYLLPNAKGANTIIFNGSGIIANGASYRIYLDFKTAENTNCTGQGVKFVFDDFSVTKSLCEGDCNPVANNDYFNGNSQGFVNSLKANVYGGYLNWASAAPAGYEMKSLSMSPAVSDGVDYDNNNHPLSSMQFVLVSGPSVISSSGCAGTPPTGTLIWNGDGTFEYTRASNCINRVAFTYKIIDPTALQSNIATVTIDFVENIPLPVKLVSFTANRNDNNLVTLKWQTASETNSTGFYVQKNSGAGWENAGFVSSQAINGASNVLLNYEFTEINTNTGLTQYRLVQQDLDGSLSYSNIRAIRGEAQALTLQVFPNPAIKGTVNILLPELDGAYKIGLFNTAGGKINEWDKVTGNVFTINNLKAGMYFLQVSNIISRKNSVVKVLVAD